MTPTIAVYIFGHSLVKIAYPFVPAIHSAISMTNYINAGKSVVYFCECQSDDGTLGVVEAEFSEEIKSGELVILKHDWGTHHTIQAHICNYILGEIGTRTTFAMKMDADEVIHEDSFKNFSEDLLLMEKYRVPLGRPHYLHFSPDFHTTWPFIYESKAVICRTESGLRFDAHSGGDACAIGGAQEYQTRLELQHFGKVHTGREREALIKERTFQKLYSHPEDHIGFPDPKVEMQADSGALDYTKVFDISMANGDFKPFIGTHPIFVQHWISEMENRERLFQKEIKHAN